MTFENVKNILLRAGRFDDIINLLKDIINSPIKDEEFLPLCFMGGRETVRYSLIRKEANSLLLYLENPDKEYNDDAFNNLESFVIYRVHTSLYNIGVHISHRAPIDDEHEAIDKSRVYLILQDLLDRIEPPEIRYFTIPTGYESDDVYGQ